MRKHLLIGLLGFVILSANAATAGIVAVQENGRTVYVDVPAKDAGDAAGMQQYAPSVHKTYSYYSKAEHRWKRVPPASGATMRKARSAAADVQQYIVWRQQQPAFRVDFGENAPETAAKPADDAISVTTASVEKQKSETPELETPSRKGLSAEQLDAIIDEAAAKHGVDSNLVRAVIKVESNFNPHAVSRKGAMGLMQLMPSTARSLQVTNPFDAKQNVDGGVRHLKSLLENFDGDVDKSVAAYNAGAGAVTRNHGIPPFAETQAYVRRINRLYSGQDAVRANHGAPIRTYRDKFGVLTFTND
jgi:soluble lytic murein transglycosylase-like protein